MARPPPRAPAPPSAPRPPARQAASQLDPDPPTAVYGSTATPRPQPEPPRRTPEAAEAEPHEPREEPQPRQGTVDRFPALERLETHRKKQKIPYIQQLTVTECGAACLAMVLGYHGKDVRLEEVREIAGVDRNGANALALLNAARWYGLRGRGVKLEVDDLDYLEPATILHWEFNHFVVFERLRKDAIDIVDPALGRRRVSMEQFGRSFTGVALLFEPTEAFEPEARARSRGWRLAREVLGQSGLWPRILVTSLLLQLFALALPVLTGALVDRVVPRGDYHLLIVLGAGLLSLVGFNFLSSMIRSHLLLHLRTQLDARMTLNFLDHLVDLPYAFFQRRSAGDLMMRLNSNTTVREILTSGALSGLLDGSLVALYLVILFVVSPTMGGVVLGLGALQLAVFFGARARQRDLMTQNLQVEAKSQSYQVEMLTGIETLKAMGGEHRAVEYWSDLFVDVLNVSLQRGRLSALVDSLQATLKMGSPLIILVAGTLMVMQGNLSLGTMLGLSALAGSFLGPLASLVATAMQLQLLSSYLERINDVLDTDPEQEQARTRQAPQLTGAIRLERVSFKYGPMAPNVVRDVSLEIHPGQLVAIVGPSGAGKSTLASLMLGLYLPSSGRILYDEHDLIDLDLRSVRRQIGIVTQSAYLFGSSIRANIGLADPTASLEEVTAAAKLAQIHDEVLQMPLGYDTPLVDRGASLSGGQRQRLALARALVRRPAILLLDEATSQLDALTERRVQHALESLRCTRIVIAHRLSTILAADLILVLDNGRLVEAGTHDQLLAHGGTYAQLIDAQLGRGG